MKKTIKRTLTAVLAAAILITVMAGCRRAPDSNFEAPEFVFVPEIIQMPGGIKEMNNLTYLNDTLYFWSMVVLDEETWDFSISLYSMNLDGSNMVELPNYSPTRPPYNDASGNVFITSLNVDNHGYIWVAESGSFYRDTTPDDFDGEDWDRTYTPVGDLMVVRKLDSTGAEISSIDISNLFSNNEFFYMRDFSLDSMGNLYVATDNEIHVLSGDGFLQFSLDVQNWIDQLIRMPDGRVAYSGWMDSGRGLRMVDFASRAWGETIDLPMTANQIFPGGESYSILFNNNTSLFGLNAETGESEKLLSWIDSDVLLDWTNSIAVLPDGRILAINNVYDRANNESRMEMIILTRVPYSDLPERTVLTFATLGLQDNLRSHIVSFNRTNQAYRIHVIDYSEFITEDDWNAGLTRLSTDIISGNVPDILDVAQLPLQQYVARNLLVDLNPFIEADPEINRSDLFDSVLRASEIDGGLYRIFPSYYVITLGGNPSVLGPGVGWGMDEFRAVMQANPQADMPLGQWLTKENFLQMAVMFGMDEYVDWAAGEVHFDNGAFAQLLEFANSFPAEIDYDREEYLEEQELIATGRQIMSLMYFWDFQSVNRYRTLYGGDVVFKGFPAESRNGNAFIINSGLSITTRCVSNDGAWEFLREVLKTDWQRTNVHWDYPTSRVVFNEMAEEAMKEDEGNSMFGRTIIGEGMIMEDGMWRPDPVTQEDVNMLITLIESINNIASYDEALMNIINEGASDFFSGRSSAQDAARIIQNRASILISEQS